MNSRQIFKKVVMAFIYDFVYNVNIFISDDNYVNDIIHLEDLFI